MCTLFTFVSSPSVVIIMSLPFVVYSCLNGQRLQTNYQVSHSVLKTTIIIIKRKILKKQKLIKLKELKNTRLENVNAKNVEHKT